MLYYLSHIAHAVLQNVSWASLLSMENCLPVWRHLQHYRNEAISLCVFLAYQHSLKLSVFVKMGLFYSSMVKSSYQFLLMFDRRTSCG